MMKTFPDGKNSDAPASSGRFSRTKKWVAFLSILLLPALVQAYRGGHVIPPLEGRIRGVSGQVGPRARLGSASTIVLDGTGVCGKIRIDFGDGTPWLTLADYDFSNPAQLAHIYRWGGTRGVRVAGLEGCTGGARTTLRIPPFAIGYKMPSATACDLDPNMPPLPMNATVHITSPPDPKISFGCFGGCSYDADGISGAANLSYPFPGLRPLSLVLRVGGGLPFQGGKNVTFTTSTGGALEVCANDSNMGDNKDAWGIFVDVDYPGAP